MEIIITLSLIAPFLISFGLAIFFFWQSGRPLQESRLKALRRFNLTWLAALLSIGITSPPLLAALILLLVITHTAYKVEATLKTENLSLYKFNVNGDEDREATPEELLRSAFDNALDAGVDPKEIMALLKERFQAKQL